MEEEEHLLFRCVCTRGILILQLFFILKYTPPDDIRGMENKCIPKM